MAQWMVTALLLALAGPAWAQPSVDAVRVYLGASGSTCTLHSGSGAPSGALGAVCDVYHRTDSPYTVYLKTGASTWSELYRAGGTDVAVADGGTGVSSWTAGDLVYASGATTLAGIADVGAGSVLVSNSGAPGWASSPTISGTLTASTALSSPTLTHAGNLTLSPTGDVILAPSGNDILPGAGYTQNLGALTNKYLTLHAAELVVETLVAQDTLATIGGRVLVGPTTTLTSDLAAASTSMVVKHNQIASGDRVLLQAGGQVEWIAVTSGPSGGGPYTYSITRDLDGSGANNWAAGDAVFNTGTTNDGFIDLYSYSGILSGSGPTIVGNVRTGTTYSQVSPRWAIGNLNGVYGYGADTYGAAFGDHTNSYLTVDATNGIRMIGDAGTMFSMGTDGNATFAGRLTVGTGRNMLGHTEFRRESSSAFGTSTGSTAGTTGPRTGVSGTRPSGTGSGSNTFWELGFYSGTGTPTWNWYCNQTNEFPTNGGACAIYAETGTNPSAASVKYAQGPSFPSAAGTRYEFSFYAEVSAATNVCPILGFYDGAGTLISAGTSTTQDCVTAAESTGGNDLSNWARGYYFATAPTNTRTVVVQVYVTNDGSANPKALITRLFFGEAGAGQTTPTPWAPGGVTLIDGTMLQTDMVISNTLRSSGATALDTGTGFWLDASSTPTFRVGDPSGNRLRWDGTNLTVASAGVTIDSTGIAILPASGGTFDAPASPTAYRFTATDWAMGTFGRIDGLSGASLALSNSWRGTGVDMTVTTLVSATHVGTSAGSAQIAVSAFAGGGNVSITGETFLSGIRSDGTGKVACVKSDESIGTCTTQPNSSGVCTCG